MHRKKYKGVKYNTMIGAIIGDIVGSKYEFLSFKSKKFPLFSNGCNYTDDTIMTIAVADALIKSKRSNGIFQEELILTMKAYGKRYPCPTGGYGTSFFNWLMSEECLPYNSFGNGSAMRVSPCALIASSLEEALELAKQSAEVTHNHPEGIMGAQATAAAIYLAKTGSSKGDIRKYICDNFYELTESVDEIREYYYFDSTCQGTVPQAITAFLESVDFEDAIRNVISLGGDADTLGAITGSIAWAFYSRDWKDKNIKDWPKAEKDIYTEVMSYLPKNFINVINDFESMIKGQALKSKEGLKK